MKLTCHTCNKMFDRSSRDIASHRIKNFTHVFCSRQCFSTHTRTRLEVSCKQCNTLFFKIPSQIKKGKNNFCSRSCSAKYRNTHKKSGTNRSKLEKWIEQKLLFLYTFDIRFNDIKTINAELDIYIPSLNLAFELNGIFHYEPIFSKERLAKISTNDDRKIQACLEKNIELCVIDTSAQKYFKPESSKQYLSIITSIIDKKLI